MADYVLFATTLGITPLDLITKIQEGLQIYATEGLLAGEIIRSGIISRTAQGLDSSESPFVPYSPSYAKQKVKAGGSASPVNLFSMKRRTHMMNTIQVKSGGMTSDSGSVPLAGATGIPIENFQVGIYGTEEAERAKIHNEGGSVGIKGTATNSKGRKYKRVRGRFVKTAFSMPQRHFFDVNGKDIQLAEQAIVDAIESRLRPLVDR